MWPTQIRMLLVLSCVLLFGAVAQAQSPYRMEGIVTDIDSKQPVANVTVQVLISSEQDPLLRIQKSQTDEVGRYSVELSAGHGMAWNLLPPTGYCPVENNATEVFATTVDSPIFTKNYQVRKGVPVRFVARYPKGVVDPPTTFISLGQQQEKEYISGFCELDDSGVGTVTLAQLGGEFKINAGDQNRTLAAADGTSARFDEGFDPRAVLAEVTEEDDGSLTVRDTHGRTAGLYNCEAMVEDNQLTIAIDLKTTVSATLTGRIVDPQENGIKGATVTVTFSDIAATTDDHGSFSVSIPKLSADQQIALSITCAGYGGIDTKPIPIDKAANRVVDAGTIKIEAGCSIRVRITDADGSPLHGAVVEPVTDFASQTRIARTGPDGECLLTGLAPGLMRISAQFGKLSETTKIPLDEGENELVILKLAPSTAVPLAELPKRPPVLAAGTVAPEWSIVEWTDGKQRKLSDYRGKVVVLDFWGVWCGPCIQAIPAMKELHNRYNDQDVVFLGIHTAGTDMTLVNRLLKQQQWDVTVGLDVGNDVVTGETVRRYAVSGFPSVIVVDRRGTIAFNSGDIPEDRELWMQELEATAKSAGLPWPIDSDATEEQLLERLTQLQVVTFSRRIDAALNVRGE